MIFDWDIDIWAEQNTPQEVKPEGFDEPNKSWIKALLKGVKVLYNEFVAFRLQLLKKMRYNAQTIVLRNLLNDLFDPTLRRIEVITTYDLIAPVYIYDKDENETHYIYDIDEFDSGDADYDPTALRTWVFDFDELGVLYDFIIKAAPGSLTDEQIVRLKATVNYYRLFGKKPGYFYTDGTTF